ncbi:MAG: histidine kinase [Clostridia bacterium]|nr:histidine kinase [Clostridia bacterium]
MQSIGKLVHVYVDGGGCMRDNRKVTQIALFIILTVITLVYFKVITDTNNKKFYTAELGYIDLSNEDINKNIIFLSGEWEFYPKEFKLSGFDKQSYIQVPKPWNDYLYNDLNLGHYSYGTYRLKIKVPQKGLYCFRIITISSAYKFFVNGKELYANGLVGTSAKNEVACWKEGIIPFYTESEDVEIVIQVSNFHYSRGGITRSIILGDPQAINNSASGDIIKSGIMIGIFAGIGFYLLLLYRIRERKYTYLYLGLFCISSVILEAVLNCNFIYGLFNDIPFDLISKLEFSSFICQLIALQWFIKSTYPKEYNDSWFRLINIINFIYLSLSVLTPNDIVNYNDIIYISILIANYIMGTLMLIKSFLKKKKYSLLLLVGSFMMVFTTIIDVLYVYTRFTQNNYTFGILFFLVCQIYVISEEVIDAFESSSEAKNMEIAYLQAQIAPHFFFNTLNNIYCLMDESLPKAKNLILSFCDFLRVKHKFDYRKNIFYSLKEEIDLIKAFVEIENVRCNGFIDLIIEIEEEYLTTLIPQLIIQPIIENSIKHGLKTRPIKITVSAIRNISSLTIAVSDDGEGMAKNMTGKVLDEKRFSSGVGLKNVNYRLMKCFKTKLNIVSELSQGTKVYFEIPMEV